MSDVGRLFKAWLVNLVNECFMEYWMYATLAWLDTDD